MDIFQYIRRTRCVWDSNKWEHNIWIVEKQSSYQDLKYSVSDLPEYSSFAIKIVMTGTDPSYVPKVQDIRAVAAF